MYINITVDNNQSGIYRISNKKNGKFYVGSTSNFRKRMREHLSDLRNNRHINNYLQNAFNKYGEENFSFQIVEYVNSISELLIVEQRLLDKLKPFDSDIGYNISKNATSYRVYGKDHHHFGVPKSEEQKRKTRMALVGRSQSDETRKKISKAVKGKNTGKDHWSYGKTRTEEHSKNISLSLKGKFSGEKNPFFDKKHTVETKRKLGIPVIKLSKQGEFIERYETMEEAAKSNNMGKSHISCCCKGTRKTTGGYMWMYAKDYHEKRATQ